VARICFRMSRRFSHVAWKPCALIVAVSFLCASQAFAAIRLSGPITPSGTGKVRIGSAELRAGEFRTYRFTFKAVPLNCEGTSETAKRLRTAVYVPADRRPSHDRLQARVQSSGPTLDYTLEVVGRRHRARKVAGSVRVHGSAVPLRGGGSADCDSGALRWKAR
jgi:hypothetical protein